MATKAKPPRGEKSQAIRDYNAQHPDAPVPEVVAELKKQGITVSQGMVYNIRAAAKKSAGRPAKKAASKEAGGTSEHGNKSQAVKAAIRELGRKTPAKEIKAHLDAQGTPVSLALVVKIKGRIRSRRKARLGRAAEAAAGSPARNSLAGTITAANLMAAKDLADRLGGVASLRKTLDVLDRLR